jgi:hypothetical protein
MSEEKPSMDEIVEGLQTGDRNIVAEAEEIYETNHNNVEVRHAAADGEVVVQLSAEFAWELDGEDRDTILPDEEAERI